MGIAYLIAPTRYRMFFGILVCLENGRLVITIYANREDVEEVKEKIYANIKLSSEAITAPKLIEDIITE